MPTAAPDIVVLDTETTGLDPEHDRVIDVGAVRLGPGLEVADTFQSLVDPGMPVGLAITRLTGITDDELRDAPPFAAVFARLRRFVGDAILVAHNASFDRDHLAAGARRAAVEPLANEWLDGLDAALLLLPELDRYALTVVAEALGIERSGHRALPDAQVTAAVFRRLCARAAGLGAEERALLTAAAWRPLRVLDAFHATPDEAPPPVVPEETRGRLTALPVDPEGWRTEFGVLGESHTAEKGRGAEPPAPALPGLAARLPGFRRRPGQGQLAAAVAGVLAAGGIGLFEAGTGMGKSLAYLLPAAFFGAAEGRRVVVSTKTKALQRQLAAHELPLVADALPPGWRWALLMGRENYVCRRRLDEAVAAEAVALPDRERALALAYLVGRARRGEVDLSALPYRAVRDLASLSEVARDLRSSRSTCLGRHCPARRACHWRLARTRAEAAHLVCVNHALLLTAPETLPPFEDVVIDEAHLLYHEATEAFSEQVDAASLATLLGDLGGGRRQRPLPGRLRAAGRRMPPEVARALERAADACERAATALPGLARAVGESLAALSSVPREEGGGIEGVGAGFAGSSEGGGFAGSSEGAGREGRSGARPAAEYDLTVRVTPGLREHPAWDPFATAAGLLSEALDGLARDVAPAAEALPEDHRERAPLAALAEDAARLAALLGDLPESGTSDTVVWAAIEAPGRATRAGFAPAPGAPAAPDAAWTAGGTRRRDGRRTPGAGPQGLSWTLTRTPLTPARQIREALWDRLRGAVLTSATLTVAGSFTYFREMTGLDADLDVAERVFPSPFDFRRQAVLVLEHDPAGAWRPEALAERQGERLKRLAEVTGGRTLALFTNRRDMNRVAGTVGPHVEDDGVLVLAQGLHGSAAALADEFRAHPQTILLGVDTLWTGQDFPGDALTCLVIAKLPFPRQDPLFQARRQACEEAGERWFEKFYLPEAVLKFRQGFGRLIRTETDHGVVVVLDHRLTQKGYRRDFLGSLPDLEVVEAAPGEIPAVVEHYLRELAPAT